MIFLSVSRLVASNLTYSKLSDVYETNTINSTLGCLFIPYFSTTKYGLKSITRKCIDSWNEVSKTLKIDLSSLSRPILKQKVQEYFISNYS